MKRSPLTLARDTLKGLYKHLPGKRPLFEMVRRVRTPPGGLYQHMHFIGPFDTRVGGKTLRLQHYGTSLENSIFWTGVTGDWEGRSVATWMRLVTDAKVVFDVGANTGVYALIAKTLNPTASVFAFEPVQRVYERLVANSRANEFDIVCERAALSNAVGTATIYDTDSDHTTSVTVNVNTLPEGTKAVPREIAITTLDAYIRQRKLARIDLMKIDVETHEPELLAGFRDHLPEMRPNMLIEVLTDEIGRKIEQSVAGLGYHFFAIDETRGLSPARELRRLPGHNLNYLLCRADSVERVRGV